MFGYHSGIAPNPKHIIDAAHNRRAERMPIYEHIITDTFIEKMLGRTFTDLIHGTDEDLREYYRIRCAFFRDMGYDCVSFECGVGGAMPGSGSLGGHKPGEIQNREDFDRYPWASVPDRYIALYERHFKAFLDVLPPDMMAIGGVGNGLFECVQDITGYMDLCYVSKDDPELYGLLFERAGEMMLAIWDWFLPRYGERFALTRMGDDMGYRTATLLPPNDFKQHLIPPLAKVIARAHAAGKPFLLHSCGCIFALMDDLIRIGINAKHSNEDQIAPFTHWLRDYGDRIALFGGIDLNTLCLEDEYTIREAVHAVAAAAREKGTGFALGSGNSIPDYVPVEGYLAMIKACNELRK